MRPSMSWTKWAALLSVIAAARANAGSRPPFALHGALSNHDEIHARARVDIAASAAQALLARKDNDIIKAVRVEGGQEVGEKRTSVGVLGVLGGALCHLVLGTTYCWGNFVPYVPQKLKFFDGVGKEGSSPDASFVLPGAFVAQMLTMPLGPYFQQKLGCKGTTLLGCGIMAAGVFLSSFAPNLAVFMLCYSFMFGAGVGLAYTAPMVNGWKWFPDKKGLVSGAVVAGFGAGGFVFNQVGTSIINPKGLNAQGGVYPKEVYDKFPVMLRRLAYIYATMSLIGAFFINPPRASTEVKTRVAKGAGPVKTITSTSLSDALKDRKFWLMWFMVLMIGTSGINVANVYKQYGGTVSVLQSDSFQSLVGSVAALCNGAGRLFWGNMLDVFGFKKMFPALAVLQTTATALYTMLSQSKGGYLFGTGLLLFCLGGNFAMFPALTTKVFGPSEGAKIYGVIFSAFAVASISGTFLTKGLMSTLGWGWDEIFKLMAFLSLCSLGALPFFKVEV